MTTDSPLVSSARIRIVEPNAMIRRRAVDDGDILGDRGGGRGQRQLKAKIGVASMGGALAVAAVIAAGAVIGCGGGKLTADASASTGAAGTGGSVGPGAAGTGGSVTTGAGGSANSTCAVPARTVLEDCTEFAPTGAVITPEQGVMGDGGVYLPGGELASPAGGTLIDGDYDLVRAAWAMRTTPTQRTIRISGGGTFFEWVIDQQELSGMMMHYRFNTAMAVSGTSINVTAIGCDGVLSNMFGFTAAGDELDLFNLSADAMFVYKRNCRR